MSIFSHLSRNNKNQFPVSHEPPLEAFRPLPEDTSDVYWTEPLTTDVDKFNWPYLKLAVELDALDRQTPKEKKADLEKVVIDDAESLVAHLLPPEVADKLHIIPHRNEDEPLMPITHRDAYIIAEAIDKTRGHAEFLDEALDYVLGSLDETSPGQMDDLKKARLLAKTNGTSIMDEFYQIGAKQDNSLYLPRTPDELEFPMDVRDHTPPELLNSTWEKMLEEREKED